MIAPLLLLGLALGPATAQANPSPVTAETRLTPERAEIGEPLTLELELVHPSEVRLRVDELLDPGDPWLILEGRRVLTRVIADRPGYSRTTASWTLCVLDAGEHQLEVGGADYEWRGIPRRIDAPPASVEVRGALADGEDAPRATVGFREPPPESEPPTRILLMVAALVVLAGAGIVWRLARGRKVEPPPAPRGPRERLAAMRADDARGLNTVYYELSAALREALDAHAGENLAAYTDEEWIERRAQGVALPAELTERAAELLRTCEGVKYGAETPTRWATEEALGEARELVAACAGAAGAGGGR